MGKRLRAMQTQGLIALIPTDTIRVMNYYYLQSANSPKPRVTANGKRKQVDRQGLLATSVE